MTKHLHLLAAEMQRTLRRAAGDLPAPVDWSTLALRIHLDTWATLYRWHRAKEPIIRITEETEAAILDDGLPADTVLATAPLKHEALACQLPDRRQWIVIARHAPAPCDVAVWQQHGWRYGQPLLTYCCNTDDGGLMAGFVNLIDQPRLRDLDLMPGRLIKKDGTMPKLTVAEITEESYRLEMAIFSLYARK